MQLLIQDIVYVTFEVILCVFMFSSAKYLLRYGKPTIQLYDKNDPSIRRPFVLPTYSMESVTYGSLFIPYIPLTFYYFYSPETFDTRIFIRFLFGWSVTGLVCYIVKGYVGRLRPNFMAINSNEIETGRELLAGILKHNPSYKELFVIESRKSFYSGHASICSYAGTFLVIFLHSLYPKAGLVMSLVKIFVGLYGLYPGVTQGICFFHHWTDVITGHLTGAFFAYFAFYYVQ